MSETNLETLILHSLQNEFKIFHRSILNTEYPKVSKRQYGEYLYKHEFENNNMEETCINIVWR